jgi:orotate phosphoribosyltransferase-like protein
VLRRGPSQIDHRHADDHGFLVGADVRGARILLVDDTLTTGARAERRIGDVPPEPPFDLDAS